MEKRSEKYEESLKACKKIINGAEEVIEEYEKLREQEGIESSSLERIREDKLFDQARSKIDSQLINITVCGAFSSGKTFLISSLLDGRYYEPSRGSTERIFWEARKHAGRRLRDHYSTFLPTAPEQTTNCLLAIVPGKPSNKHSRLEILFDDGEEWEDKTIGCKSEEAVARRLLGYVTKVENYDNFRKKKDKKRNVVAGRLHVADMPLPAVVYDLPGIEGDSEPYLEIVQKAVVSADCIIYVASAERELTGKQLELLRFIDEVSEKTNCLVIFVLSKIDYIQDWEKVLKKNNKFLSLYFRNRKKINSKFSKEKFRPLSAAEEVLAHSLYRSPF